MKSYKIIVSIHFISKSYSPLVERLNETTANPQIPLTVYNEETLLIHEHLIR